MRLIVFCLLSLLSLTAASQKIEKFFDYKWQPCEPGAARFYGVIVKKDSGWHRSDYFLHDLVLQMDGTFDDSACTVRNGRFYFFYPDKKLSSRENYVHGKLQGVYMSYNKDGVIDDTLYYEAGHPTGTELGWYSNGYPKDSTVWQKDSTAVQVTWFSKGQPASAGHYSHWSKRNGRWQFFHKTGKMAALELYQDGNLLQKQYFDEEGNYMDTNYHDHGAQFPDGADAWVKYLSKHLYFPDQYKITNSDKAVTEITFTIDEDGKVQDAYVSIPFYPAFDRIALNVIQHSPAWQPAIWHNRRVNYTQKQAVTFSQEGRE